MERRQDSDSGSLPAVAQKQAAHFLSLQGKIEQKLTHELDIEQLH